jgi:hypothetical protein
MLQSKLTGYRKHSPEPVANENSYRSMDSPTIVTTFAAQNKEIEKVKVHFENYKRNVVNLGIDLRISIRNPEI